MNDGHVRDMNLHKVVLARTPPQLAHSLDKRHALDIAHSTTQLNYTDVRLLARVVDRNASDPLDPVLDRICDVGDDLHCFTQVVALALALDDVLVDFARGDVVVAGQSDVEVALVVAEIEVDFTAVGEDEDFAMPVCGLVSGAVLVMVKHTPWGSWFPHRH